MGKIGAPSKYEGFEVNRMSKRKFSRQLEGCQARDLVKIGTHGSWSLKHEGNGLPEGECVKGQWWGVQD